LSSAYVLSTAAEVDLRDIVRYTRKEWGDIQARRYLANLKNGIEGVASGQGHFRTVPALFPDLRIARCEHHYIFCLPRSGAPALVVAILYERMDLMTRLADRLK
jgi:toxin ParE1/3/4